MKYVIKYVHTKFEGCLNSFENRKFYMCYYTTVALGIFPEIDKRSLLNNCSLGKNFKKIENIALSTSKNMLIRHVVYSS